MYFLCCFLEFSSNFFKYLNICLFWYSWFFIIEWLHLYVWTNEKMKKSNSLICSFVPTKKQSSHCFALCFFCMNVGHCLGIRTSVIHIFSTKALGKWFFQCFHQNITILDVLFLWVSYGFKSSGAPPPHPWTPTPHPTLSYLQ